MPRQDQVANPPNTEKHQRYSEHSPKQKTDEDADVDAMSEDSFPASDPPSTSAPARAGRPEREKEKKEREQVRKQPEKSGSH
jgi:hypothetical protein